jgi:NADPH:quinone reductase-like Zn-dependent oxidoreductase
MRRADAMLSGGLRGKTVLIPGGLSGTGSIAIQLAKNVFGAGKIITTLSTAKILKAEELLGKNTIDQLVDYTKQDPNKVIGKEQIDYLYDTMKLTMPSLPIMKNGGVIVSVSMGASGKDLNQALPGVPIILRWILDMKDWYYRIRARRVGVEYRFHLATHDGNGLKDMATWIEEGKVKPIVGRTAKFSDINGIRKGCQEVFDGKGGIGKFVIEME